MLSDYGRPNREEALVDAEVGVADARILNPHENFIRSELGDGEIADLEGAVEGFKDRRLLGFGKSDREHY